MNPASKFSKLAIISDCIHVMNDIGDYGTTNHVFRKQMEALAAQYEHTLIVCPLIKARDEIRFSSYKSSRIKFHFVKNVGGKTLAKKIEILSNLKGWFKAYKQAFQFSEIVYLRFPNNINIPALFYFLLKKKPMVATYTGNWNGYKGEPFTYRMQRFLLKTIFRGPVFVYSSGKLVQSNIYKGISPSYSEKEWWAEEQVIQHKLVRAERDKKSFTFICVGALTPDKDPMHIVQTFSRLKKNNHRFSLYFIGDGILKDPLLNFIDASGLNGSVFLTGYLTEEELKEYYRKADFIVHASKTEGFVKSPRESMMFGVVPIVNTFNLSEEITGHGSRGFVFNVKERDGLYNLIQGFYLKPFGLPHLIKQAREYSKKITLEAFSEEYRKKVSEFYL